VSNIEQPKHAQGVQGVIPPAGSTPMQAYRVYVVAPDGHITAPAQVIECESEQQAIGTAAQLTNGKSVELW
jgi:hypothetical protein